MCFPPYKGIRNYVSLALDADEMISSNFAFFPISCQCPDLASLQGALPLGIDSSWISVRKLELQI